jgi:outer membrane receptor for ferrienterochelin and colicins
MFKKLFSMLAFTAITVFAQAQDVKVSGTITDANGSAIPGALVIEKGTTNAVKTKNDGTYTLSIPTSRIPTTIIVRSIGSGSSEFSVDGSESAVTFNSSLGSNSRNLDEVVISASKKSEKILNAPASVSVISEAKIQQNTSLSVIDNVRKVAAVDVVPTGLVSNNVVMRGFNNIFSGASMFMIDNRLASVPSLRVNAFQLTPTSNVDVRSMEIVRGPASALYGPFAANGVLAVYTKSPLDMENRMEVTLGLTSGFRSGDDDNAKYFFKANNSLENLGILNPEIRIAGKLSKTLGVKVSGNYLSASDYAFFDSREANHVNAKFGNLSAGKPWTSDGTPADTFNRDFKIKKVAVEAKLEWRPAVNTELSYATGYSSNTNMELTGLGGAQAKDWVSTYHQFQAKKDKFWFQAFINSTNSGNTFLIPQVPTQTQFTYLKENSDLIALQAQHSSKYLQNKLSLVYGFDWFMTRPSGNVYGRFDKNANINQYGGYLQGEYKFNKKWSATAATRLDYQDAISEWMLSPRAAIVFKPRENHTFRATYNRAFSSPTALNFFLDLFNGSITGTLNGKGVPNSIRAFGNSTGIKYNLGADGNPNLTANNGSVVPLSFDQLSTNPAIITSVKNGLKQVLIGQFLAAGAPLSSANSSATLLMNGMNPTSLAPVDAVTGKPINVKAITNKEAIASTVTQTWEAGYKGVLSDKLSIGLDVYYTRINNFSSPLTNVAYQVAVDPTYYANPAVQAQMLANINAAGPFRGTLVAGLTGNPNSSNTEIITAYTTALIRAGAVANAGTIAPDNTGTDNDVVLTYLNLGTVDIFGSDLSFNFAATKLFNIEGAFSFMNKDRIELQGAADGYISLNAPKYKSALNFEYKLPIDNNGVSARLGWRWSDKFDANSGVYAGRVNAVNMFDLGLSWRPSTSKSTVLSLTVNNIMDYRHQYFPNSSGIGRVALFKVLHTFGVK